MMLIFVTHATSVDNERGLASGHCDVPLSETGELQAQELGRRYEQEELDAVFCSDLQRSYRTGEIAFGGRGVPLIRDARLRECDYGLWTQQLAREVEADKVRRISKPFPEGESHEMVVERVRDFLRGMQGQFEGKQVLVIGHRATQYAIEHLIRGIALRDVIVAPWEWQPGWRYQVGTL